MDVFCGSAAEMRLERERKEGEEEAAEEKMKQSVSQSASQPFPLACLSLLNCPRPLHAAGSSIHPFSTLARQQVFQRSVLPSASVPLPLSAARVYTHTHSSLAPPLLHNRPASFCKMLTRLAKHAQGRRKIQLLAVCRPEPSCELVRLRLYLNCLHSQSCG